jgi:hypothetical protein
LLDWGVFVFFSPCFAGLRFSAYRPDGRPTPSPQTFTRHVHKMQVFFGIASEVQKLDLKPFIVFLLLSVEHFGVGIMF